MRSLLVLILVAAAVTGFFFLSGDGAEGPGPVGLTPDQQAAPAGPQVEPTDPATLERVDREQASVERTADSNRESLVEEVVAAPADNTLGGSVVNEEGKPVKDARVTLTRWGSTTLHFQDQVDRSSDRQTKTDGKGQYSFRSIPTEHTYAIKVRHPDYSPVEVGSVQVSETSREEPQIVLKPGTKLTGVVNDSGGNAVAGAEIFLSSSMSGILDADDPDVALTSSGTTGEFSFNNVGKGNYSLTVSAQGYGKVTLQQVAVTDTDVHRDVTLEVASMIAGRVRNAKTGEALEAVSIEAFLINRRSQQTRSKTLSEESGEFLLEDIPEGSYTILVNADGFRTDRQQRIDAGRMDVLVELVPLPTVTGKVMFPNGKPAVGAKVRLREVHENQPVPIPVQKTNVVVDKNGEFMVAAPKAGNYVAEGMIRGYAHTTSDTFAVPDGQDVTGITVTLSKGGSLIGKIVSADGKPVRGARITTHDNDWTDDAFMRALGDMFPTQAVTRTVSTRADGTFRVEGLTPTTYQIQIKHSSYSSEMRKGLLVSEASESDAGTITILAGAVVRGTVYDPTGSALPGAVVQLQSEPLPGQNGFSYEGKTNSEGKYEIKNVKGGTYWMSVRRTSMASANPFENFEDHKQTKRKVPVSDGQNYDGIDFNVGG